MTKKWAITNKNGSISQQKYDTKDECDQMIDITLDKYPDLEDVEMKAIEVEVE